MLGLLGVLHLYDQMQSLLATVAPHGVITFIDGLHRDQSGSAKVFALVVGGAGGDLGGQRRDGLADQGRQPRVRAKRRPARSGGSA